jgi:hypothetical protein
MIYCRNPSTRSNSSAMLLDFELIILTWVRTRGETHHAYIQTCRIPSARSNSFHDCSNSFQLVRGGYAERPVAVQGKSNQCILFATHAIRIPRGLLASCAAASAPGSCALLAWSARVSSSLANQQIRSLTVFILGRAEIAARANAFASSSPCYSDFNVGAPVHFASCVTQTGVFRTAGTLPNPSTLKSGVRGCSVRFLRDLMPTGVIFGTRILYSQSFLSKGQHEGRQVGRLAAG